jgi:hypothetical protein
MTIFALIPIFGILNNMVIILPPHLVLKKIIFIPIFRFFYQDLVIYPFKYLRFFFVGFKGLSLELKDGGDKYYELTFDVSFWCIMIMSII